MDLKSIIYAGTFVSKTSVKGLWLCECSPKLILKSFRHSTVEATTLDMK